MPVVKQATDDELFAVAAFHNKSTNVPEQARIPWSALATGLTNHEERLDKDGRLWSPALFKPGGTRCNDNVVLVSCAVLDFDGGVAWDEIKPLLDGYTWAAHSTFRHTDEDPRFRVVIPIPGGVLRDSWDDAWRRIANIFPGLDPADKDPSRMYYLPAHKPGAPWWTATND